MSSSLVKCPNIRYILIIRVEDIGKVSVVHQFITTIKNSHHWYSFPIQYLLYLKNLGVVIVLTKKLYQEVQRFEGWYPRALRGVLTDGKDILCLGIGILIQNIGTPPPPPHHEIVDSCDDSWRWYHFMDRMLIGPGKFGSM